MTAHDCEHEWIVDDGDPYRCTAPATPLTTAASAWVQGTVRGHPGAVMDLPSPEKENLGLKKTSASQYY
jgi:hypothetical protein